MTRAKDAIVVDDGNDDDDDDDDDARARGVDAPSDDVRGTRERARPRV